MSTSKIIIFFMFFSIAFGQEKKELKKVNIDKSRLFWIGEKVGGEHEGYVQISSGEITISKNNEGRGWRIVDGSFVINMNSIECIDLQGDWKNGLEEHLKDEDFFDTKKYPESTFEFIADNESTIEGVLTIKGISKKIKFDYKGNKTKDKIIIIANIIVNRTDFDINYKSSSVFPELVDNFIYDDFTITLEPIIFE